MSVALPEPRARGQEGRSRARPAPPWLPPSPRPSTRGVPTHHAEEHPRVLSVCPPTGVGTAEGPVPGGPVPSAPGEDGHPDAAPGGCRAQSLCKPVLSSPPLPGAQRPGAGRASGPPVRAPARPHLCLPRDSGRSCGLRCLLGGSGKCGLPHCRSGRPPDHGQHHRITAERLRVGQDGQPAG